MRANAEERAMNRDGSPPAMGATRASDMTAIVELTVTRR